MQQAVYVRDLGNMEYGDAWRVQDALLLENTNKKIKLAKGEDAGETIHHLLFCEHPPVYTLGKSGKEEHVLISKEELAQRNIGYYPTNRGGDITFHGPGQVVGYPIIDLEKFFTDIGPLWIEGRPESWRNGCLVRSLQQDDGQKNMCHGCTLQQMGDHARICTER